ncbi:hypothetical protein ACHWQZ_G011464 [Mnemiopsis leidyi]
MKGRFVQDKNLIKSKLQCFESKIRALTPIRVRKVPFPLTKTREQRKGVLKTGSTNDSSSESSEKSSSFTSSSSSSFLSSSTSLASTAALHSSEDSSEQNTSSSSSSNLSSTSSSSCSTDASSAGESSEEVKGKKNSEVKRDVRTEQPRARKKVHFNLNHSQIRRKSPGCRKYGNQTNVDGKMKQLGIS